MDPQYNESEGNNLESVGGRKKSAKKMRASSITYPQKRILGTEKRVNSDPTTSPKRVVKKNGAAKYVNFKTRTVK